MPSKWDFLLDQKPVPIREHLLKACAELFAKDLKAWPPPVEEVTGADAALLQDAKEPPAPELLRQAFLLARFDLSRELEAYDEYMRNRRWLEAGLQPKDKPMLLFLSRFIEEQLLSLKEATEGRVDRPALLRVLDLTERAVLKVSEA